VSSEQNLLPLVEEVLDFWFGPPPITSMLYKQRRKRWFSKNPEFDRQIYDRFYSVYEQAATGTLDHWQHSPLSNLALILVLDQFPRNMFRNTPQAFATDAKARETTRVAIEQAFDRVLAPVQRLFVYLPLEHSENLDDQNQSVQLVQVLIATHPELLDCLDYAQRHQAVIERFGRFPHRNRILGRDTTPEEAEFLKQPGSSF